MQIAEALHRFICLFEEGNYFRGHTFVGISHSIGCVGLLLSTVLLPPIIRFEQLVMVENVLSPLDPNIVGASTVLKA